VSESLLDGVSEILSGSIRGGLSDIVC
jgi:hypothetical protein